MSELIVYGTDWCEDTVDTRAWLTRAGVPFEYINIDQDAAAREWVKAQNHGKQTTPTILIDRHLLLIEPSADELDAALGSQAEH